MKEDDRERGGPGDTGAGMRREDFHVDPDIRKAWTLPARFYRDPLLFEAGRERIFARSWHLSLDRVSLSEPGRVIPTRLLEDHLDEPILWTRDASGQLHCLSNACTHRGNLVAPEPASLNGLRCRYHGRRFDLDGRFRSMPEFEDVADFPAPCDDLGRIPFGEWGPFLFASPDPAVPFSETMKPITDRIPWIPAETFQPSPERSRDFDVGAHWALYCDNYLEGFHIPFVHESLNETIEYETYGVETFPGAILQTAIAKLGEPAFDPPAGHPDRGRNIAAYYFFIFPNLMLNFYPWGLSVNIVRPLAMEATRVEFRTWIWREDLYDRGAGSGLDRVELEDEEVVEAVQAGLKSRSYRRGRFSPAREAGVHHFHRLLARRLFGA